MYRILIAGGSGYIGSHLISFLKDNTTITTTACNNTNVGGNVVELDLSEKEIVFEFVQKSSHFDILIFLVGLAHKKGKKKDLKEFMRVNYHTLENLLDAFSNLKKIPKKIIFASSISVYGEKLYQNKHNENSESTPFSPYAISKKEAEKYLLNNYNERTWILRLAPVYSSDFLLNIERRSIIGKIFYRVGEGFAKLSLCNVKNIEITIKAIIDDEVPKGIYNISDKKDYSYNDILKKMNAMWVLTIPSFLVKIAYAIGIMNGNVFLKENAVKLLTDNIYESKKIENYVKLNYTIDHLNVRLCK